MVRLWIDGSWSTYIWSRDDACIALAGTIVFGIFCEAILMSYSVGFGICIDTDVDSES